MEYCLQAVCNSVTKVAGRRERAVAVGEGEDEVYLEKDGVVMQSSGGKGRNIGLICIIIGRMYYQRVSFLPWRLIAKQFRMMFMSIYIQSPLQRLIGLDDRVWQAKRILLNICNDSIHQLFAMLKSLNVYRYNTSRCL